jgi:uncharacterized protein (UPF0332 family)
MTPFDWDDFLAIADRLAAEVDDEAAQRTAINRAYYAAYHAAAVFVRAKGILTVGHTHRTVWAALIADPDPDRSQAGRRGDDLRRLRTDADYKRPFPGDVGKTAAEVIAESRDIVETLDRLT